MVNYCDICGCKITEENDTSFSNLCVECAGGGAEILIHLLGG